jgi:sterol 14-demethylase
MTTAIVPRVSGGEEEHGHLEEFRTDPIGLMNRVREECGDVGWFQLVDKNVIFLSGAEANEFFFRSADEDLDQAEAYPFMTPIFFQRRGIRRQSRAPQGDAAQLCAAR